MLKSLKWPDEKTLTGSVVYATDFAEPLSLNDRGTTRNDSETVCTRSLSLGVHGWTLAVLWSLLRDE